MIKIENRVGLMQYQFSVIRKSIINIIGRSFWNGLLGSMKGEYYFIFNSVIFFCKSSNFSGFAKF